MKNNFYVFALLIFTLMFCSCSNKTNEETGKEFLNNFYTIVDPLATTDSLNNYESLLKNSENSDQIINEYHSDYIELMTTKGYKSFILNRSLLKIQSMAIGTGSSFSPSDIKLSKNGNFYDFSVTITVSGDSEYTVNQNGQIIFSADGLIDNIFFENLSDLNKGIT